MFIRFLFLFLLFISSAFAQGYTIAECKIAEIQWTEPTDGSIPDILHWDAKIFLDDGSFLQISDSEIEEKAHPNTLFETGDQVEILNEHFFPNDLETSWYRVRIERTGQEYDMWGKSGKIALPEIPSEIDIVMKNVYVLDSESGLELRFHVNGIYYSLPISSSKYHGYYSQLPITVISQTTMSKTAGQYQIALTFVCNGSNEEITALSPVLYDSLHVTDVSFVKTKVSIDQNEQPYVETWVVYLSLNDGRKFTLYGTADKPLSSQLDETICEGDEVIIEEWQTHEAPLNNSLSYYTFFDVVTKASYGPFVKEVYNPSS